MSPSQETPGKSHFCLFVRFSSPLRASRELRRTRRSTPGGMSKVFALIINSLFSALPTHQRSPGAIRLSKKSLLRISTVELPITPTSYSSPSSHLLLQNPSRSGASRRTVDGGAFSRGPDLLLSARCHRFNSVSVQGGRRPSRDILHLFCVCETRLLIHCTVVLFKVAVKRLILCNEPLLPQPSAAEAAGHAVHLLCYCICLIMHVNTVEMHSPADQ